ncbi:inositol monophosphatase family protein [Mesorhizobium sp. ASY16-5R]|uniref:inositol monophosphatase family protein n=1 Tax=Mesorhizobium sp. ASY16-5R TaxID=3445772 RepID=UPI003F9F2107
MNRPTIPTSTLHLLPDVVEAVKEAGVLIREEFHRAGGPRGHDGHAPVDEDVEELLKRRLMALYPCGWLGEETSAIESPDGSCWVVDPNDGTRDFLKLIRGSAISVALLKDCVPVLGVVYAPVAPDDRGDLFAWGQGGVLTRNGEPVRPVEANRPSLVAMTTDAADYALHNHLTLPGFRVRAVPAPAYRLALAAVGEVDAGVSMAYALAPWDIAGGHALLSGAGKVLVDGAGKAIDYRQRQTFDGCIGGFPEIVAAVAKARTRPGIRKPRNGTRPKARVSDPLRLSYAHGCLLGQLTGDALGSAVEFETAAAIARRYPDGVRTLKDGGTWNLIAGQPTDDSEMALALARSLVKDCGFNRDAVARAYIGWRKSGPFDIGVTTSSGIGALEAGRPAASASQSNGALMRAAPIGIFAAGNPKLAAEIAVQDALLTHPDPVCLAANAAFAAAIAAGVNGITERGPEAMHRAAYDHADTGEAAPGAQVVRDCVVTAGGRSPKDYQHQMGWVLTALGNAFFWLMRDADLEEAVIGTVKRGGDTDTNAAVCGALLGAFHGRDAVPLQWRNAVLTCRPVAAKGVHHPRPMDYWPDDALDLAEALLTANSN